MESLNRHSGVHFTEEEINELIEDHLLVAKEHYEMKGIPVDEEKEKKRLEQLYEYMNKIYGKHEDSLKWWWEFSNNTHETYRQWKSEHSGNN